MQAQLRAAQQRATEASASAAAGQQQQQQQQQLLQQLQLQQQLLLGCGSSLDSPRAKTLNPKPSSIAGLAADCEALAAAAASGGAAAGGPGAAAAGEERHAVAADAAVLLQQELIEKVEAIRAAPSDVSFPAIKEWLKLNLNAWKALQVRV